MKITATQTKREQAIEIIKSRSIDFLLEEYNGQILFTYVNANGKPCFGKFRAKSAKLSDNYNFNTVDQRTLYIDRIKAGIDSEIERNTNYFAEAEKRKSVFQKDAILYSSWGYEQTNIDFYKIIDRSGDTVTLVKIGQNKEYEGQDSGKTMPNPEIIIGEPFKKRISKYASVKIDDCRSASPFDGRPKYWSSYY